MEKISAGGGDARKAAPDVTADLPPHLGGGAAAGVGRPRRRAARSDRGGAARPRRRRSCARTPRANGCRAGWCCSTRTATSNRRPPSTRRWPRPGWTPISSAAPASTARSRSGSSASARARRRCSTRPRPPARARRTATSTPRRCTRGRAATRRAGNRDVAMAHYARVEAEHADHSYADDARAAIGGAGDRRGRRGRRRQAAGRDPDALPEGRPAERGAVAAGVLVVARGARRRGAPLAGREPAPRSARGGLVRRGTRPVLEGARVREAGQDRRRRAPGTSAPCASIRCRSTRCCR